MFSFFFFFFLCFLQVQEVVPVGAGRDVHQVELEAVGMSATVATVQHVVKACLSAATQVKLYSTYTQDRTTNTHTEAGPATRTHTHRAAQHYTHTQA